MGVRGLTTYVKAQGLFSETYELRDTTLVIDGNGLCYYLYGNAHYNLDCRYGGQYVEFEEKVKLFFDKLTSHRVKPYVVFDGMLDDTGKKWETTMVRKKERIKRVYDLWNNKSSEVVQPHLIKLITIKILRELRDQDLRVEYAVADFEADSDIASLANSLACPVMGSDSDYFIFNIEKGYIPFDQFDLSGSSVFVTRFHSTRLATHLNIHPTMLPILASLVGNDYVSDEMLKPFKTHVMQISSHSQSISRGNAIISATAKFLSGSQSFEDAIKRVLEKSSGNKDSLENALRLSVAEYKPKSTELIDYFANGNLNNKLQTCNKREVPKWIIKLYREGVFGKQCMSCLCYRTVFLKVQVEDMSKPSANQLTLEIRKFIYKLLMKYDEQVEKITIKEYDRKNSSLTQRGIIVELSTDDTEVTILNLPTLDSETKVAYLLKLLHCDLATVQHLPNPCQLVVAALRYWLFNAKPPVTDMHLASLLAYHVGINDDQIDQTRYHHPLHGFAQWQDVVYWVSYLNSIFGDIFPSLDPVKLYDGKKVCKLYENLKSNGIQIVNTVVSDPELFQQLYDAVVKNLPSHVKFNQSGKATDMNRKERKEQKATRTKAKSAEEFLRGNHFAELCLSSSDED